MIPTAVHAVIFDLDGVLWHSTPVHARSFEQVLAQQNITGFDYTRYAGMATRECLIHFFRERAINMSEDMLNTLAIAKNQLVLRALREHPPLAPDCRNILERICTKRPVALASSASPSTIDLFLDLSGCRTLFSVILNSSNVTRAKPAPDIYRLACEMMAIAPSQALVIEDAVSGVLAGKAAGALVWAVPTTCPGATLLAAGADRIIESLSVLA